jgi:protein SCO1
MTSRSLPHAGSARLIGLVAAAMAMALATGLAAPVAAADATASPDPAASVQPAPAVQPAASGAPLGGLGGAVEGPALPQPAPPLADLINSDGTAFDLAAFAGHPLLVFFGYTHCPDICPTTIGEVFGVFAERPETQALFVSVDPERDSPEFLAQWTAYFPENFHAVTGSPGAIRRAADAWGVKYARVEGGAREGYTMSHTANVYLIDGAGQWQRTYGFGTPAAQMAADIAALSAG